MPISDANSMTISHGISQGSKTMLSASRFTDSNSTDDR